VAAAYRLVDAFGKVLVVVGAMGQAEMFAYNHVSCESKINTAHEKVGLRAYLLPSERPMVKSNLILNALVSHDITLPMLMKNVQLLFFPYEKQSRSWRANFMTTSGQYVLSFSLQYHHHTHQPQHDLLQPWVLAQQDRDVSHKRDEAGYASHDVFFAVEEGLAGGIEFGIVGNIVVTLREEAERCFAAEWLVPYSPHATLFSIIGASEPQHPNQRIEANLPSTISPHHTMHDRNVLALHIVHHDLANLCVHSSIPQEKQISSLERWLHGP
jgi:hypothetical protein